MSEEKSKDDYIHFTIGNVKTTKPEKEKKVKPAPSVKKSVVVFTGTYNVFLDRKVKIAVKEGIELPTNDLEVIKLDKKDPTAILHIYPELYNEYLDKKNNIYTHVAIGDKVKVSLKYKTDNNPVRTVSNLYFAGLENMSIIIAVLDDKSYHPAHYLEKYIKNENRPD